MRGPAVLALLLLLAGCTTPTDDTATGPPPSEQPLGPPAAFTAGNDASGCYEAVLVVLVDLEDAQARLPANWTAADAQALLATPMPTGKGAVWLNGYHCAQSELEGGDMHGAELGILAEPPKVVGGEVTDAALHLYMFAQATPGGAAQRMLDSIGMPYIPAHVEASFGNHGLAHEGELAVVQESGTLYSFSYATLAAEPMTTTASFWHENDAGLAYVHFALDSIPVFQGTATGCTLTGLAQDLAGTSSCAPGQGLALAIPEQAWESTFHWLPGARAAK